MAARKVKNDVFYVGVQDWDRELFDELIPLNEGTSYNSYLIKGSQKNALIDTVDPSKKDLFIENIKSLGLTRIDYVISQHAEQDHSGSIPKVLELYPEAKVVTNQKCKEFLKSLLLIDDSKFITINDGDELSLGDKTLKFLFTPWVHWPETMSTYLKEDKILFTCDFFGSHVASTELFVGQKKDRVIEGAKRYYAEIMMPFRSSIRSNIKKVEEMKIDLIAPSHGQIYDQPDLIINAYKDWISDNVENKVTVLYLSMHGSTQKMIERLIDDLTKFDIVVEPFNLTKMDVGKLAISLVDSATAVVATPTMLVGVHPNVAYAMYLFNALRPKTKFVAIVNSYSWGGQAIEQIKGILSSFKGELLSPVTVNGYPKAEDMKAIDSLAESIFKKHKEIGIA
ncbi:FprA family A-type flavoprotein [Athalassotoga saccharophila]|uniref:FprA family A-type flavoprotein n=1 Tax=Athalassotoga saccharophila TaxID=1441386 RepID=UPI00137B5BA8|nr:FprA family A-type flavoprotein [Athalassotoga saccharophila]BBJ27304.1 lactamase [Athalassotoga saccharophila]